jgi:YebC/PmpR family DNA-binding regulatory protein
MPPSQRERIKSAASYPERNERGIHGRSFQVGQHPAPQRPPGREARQGLDTRDPRDHGRGARLRLAIEKAKAVNLPADTIKRNVDKATGNLEGAHYEEIRYEGYGIGGAAIIVDTMTDNRVRTVAEVRHAFSKHGGNLGTDGSVAFQFKHCGQFVFAPGASEDKVMEVALDAGADDVISGDDGAIEVLCAPADFEAVQQALHKAGLKPDLAEVTWRADNSIELGGDDSQRMQKLLDVLEDLDDTQAVYHNAVLE